MYGYAGGDPANNSDPFGLCFFGVPCPAAVTAVGGTVALVGEGIGVGAAATAAAPFVVAAGIGAGLGIGIGKLASILSSPIAPTTDAQVAGALVSRDATTVQSLRSKGKAVMIGAILGLPVGEVTAGRDPGASDQTTTGAGAPDVPSGQTATEKKTKAEQRPPDPKNPN